MMRSRELLLILLLSFAPAVSAQTIDFETLPGGATTADQQTISSEYASLGVIFSILDRTTGQPVGSPRIAKAGAPQTAFEGCTGPDTPRPNLGLGISFLTDGTSLGVDGDLLIEYSTPVAAASGVILDIDCRNNGGPPCEQWTITAFDSAGVPIDTLVIDGPPGPINPECLSPNAGPGDAEAFGWAFDVGAPLIRSIILRYTGAATSVGLAFDNFSVSSVAPLTVPVVSSPADTICPGEPVVLTASVSGGVPPYGYQWQIESGMAWSDLGTDNIETVMPIQTSRYRVRVTDTMMNQAISAPFEVTILPGDSLCTAALLVSSNINNSVLRYSLRSGLPQVFVSPGSGSLNSTSKLVCGPDANLYVSSQANDRILRFDGATGAFIDVFVPQGSGGLDLPVGLDFGPNGNLYVASASTNSVIQYDGATGALVGTFIPAGSNLNTPTGMIFGEDGNLYVSSRNGHRVLRFNGTTGAYIDDFVTAASGGLNTPRGLVFGPDGNLYIGEETNDSVRRYDGTTGAFIDVFVSSGSGGLDRANDVLFDLHGTLYVASFNNDRVLRYDGLTGAFLGSLDNTGLDGAAWLSLNCDQMVSAVIDHPAARLLTLYPPVPNPTPAGSRIAFHLEQDSPVVLEVFDVAGRRVRKISCGQLHAGPHEVAWDGKDEAGIPVRSGLYLYRLTAGGQQAVRRSIVVR